MLHPTQELEPPANPARFRLLAGVFNGDVHMAEGMLIHQLSVLVVIANAMRLLRVPRGPGGRRPAQATVPATA